MKVKQILLGVLLLSLSLGYELKQWRREMSQDAKTAWRYFFIAVLGIAVVRLLCGCAHPTTVPTPAVPLGDDRYVISYEDSLPAAGITACTKTGVPIIYLDRRLLEGSGIMVVMVHELTHVRDMLSFGKCEEYMHAFKTSPEFRLRAESRAYCKEIEVGVEILGWDRTATILEFSRWLATSSSYQLGMPLGKVEEYMTLTCKEIKNESP